MPALDQLQTAMMRALDHGPDFLPDHLFAGTRVRVLTGMKVHANTISHARLVALEDTFPRVRAWMGPERFNEHSRLYLEQPGVTARMLARIGDLFPGHLAGRGEARAAVDLARFEWLWLEAYHAAEAPWLRLADLAGIEPQALMEMAIKAHPAASLDHFEPEVNRLIGEEVPGLADAHAILLTRPEAQVLVSPATPAMRAVFCAMEIPITIGNLLASLSEPDCKDQLSPDDFMPALIALLEVGALQRVE
jgi:hypothetical protein